MELTRIMFIEYKGESLTGNARIGRVKFTKSGKSIRYNGQLFLSQQGRGFKSNYFDQATREPYWISGCRKDGADRLYGERLPIYIDEDVREEYWTIIRGLSHLKDTKVING